MQALSSILFKNGGTVDSRRSFVQLAWYTNMTENLMTVQFDHQDLGHFNSRSVHRFCRQSPATLNEQAGQNGAVGNAAGGVVSGDSRYLHIAVGGVVASRICTSNRCRCFFSAA